MNAWKLVKGKKVYRDIFGMAEFTSYEHAAECNNEILGGTYRIVKSEKSIEEVDAERAELWNRLKNR